MNVKETIVCCEQFNVNDDRYKITDVLVTSGQAVKKGELVMILDSSKASYDIYTEQEGCFYTPFKNGDHVGANEPMYLLLENYNEANRSNYDTHFNLGGQQEAGKETASTMNQTVTKKAQQLLDKHGLDVSVLGAVEVVTEQVVRNYLDASGVASKLPPLELKGAQIRVVKKLAVLGAGQALIQMLDIMPSNQYMCTAIYDDNTIHHGKRIYGTEVRGAIDPEFLKKEFEAGVFDELIISVGGSTKVRKLIFDKVAALDIPFANLIHPTAHVGHHCIIGSGNIILPFVHIGPCSQIGNNNLVSAHCNIEHHNSLGSHCTFGPGVMMSGTVTIGDQVKFGTGIFIEPLVSIGKESIVSSGCIVTKHIPEKHIAFMKQGDLKFKEIQ